MTRDPTYTYKGKVRSSKPVSSKSSSIPHRHHSSTHFVRSHRTVFYNNASSSRRSSKVQPSVAVSPYFKYNKDLEMLFVATGPAFTEQSREGRFSVFPAHMNRMMRSIRESISQMSSTGWGGVRNDEPRDRKILSNAMDEMYLFETDADTPPTEREGEYKLSVYLTKESRPRQVPSGHTGLYEATVPESEAEMKNHPTV
jgi:hypothetical protein